MTDVPAHDHAAKRDDPVLDLRPDFSRFRAANPKRINLAAHSHHEWPDVTFDAQIRCWEDAARLTGDKWQFVLGELLPGLQEQIAAILNLPDPRTIAITPNTHALVNRILSCFPRDRPVRVLTTDAEFHSFRRQVARLEEDSLVSCTHVPAEPNESFAARFRDAAAKGGHDLVFVSQVFFTSGATCGDIESLVAAVPDGETFVVIDGYHGYMARPTDLSKVAARRRLQIRHGGRRHLFPALPSRLRPPPTRHRLVCRVRRARDAGRQGRRISGRRLTFPRGDLRSRRDLPHARRAHMAQIGRHRDRRGPCPRHGADGAFPRASRAARR
jgi:hypothetical protein